MLIHLEFLHPLPAETRNEGTIKFHSQCTVTEKIITTPHLGAAVPGSPGPPEKH